MLKPTEVVRALKRCGFEELRQEGSHLILGNRETKKITVVPMHRRDLRKGTLGRIIKQTGLSHEEFVKLL